MDSLIESTCFMAAGLVALPVYCSTRQLRCYVHSFSHAKCLLFLDLARRTLQTSDEPHIEAEQERPGNNGRGAKYCNLCVPLMLEDRTGPCISCSNQRENFTQPILSIIPIWIITAICLGLAAIFLNSM